MDDDPLKSRYEPLVPPEPKPTIPVHLLGKLSDQDRYVVEALSRVEQQNTWLIGVIVRVNNAIIDLDVRQQRSERWQSKLSSKWAVIAAVGVLVLPVLLKAVIDHFWK